MKKILSIIVGILAFTTITPAQPVLYGLSGGGRTPDPGAIVSYRVASNSFSVIKSFESIERGPSGGLIKGPNGKLYGVTSYGGRDGAGAIFSFDPSTNAYTKVHDFDFTNGRNPIGSLLLGTDDKLYGMTSGSGCCGPGAIFSFDPFDNNYTKLIEIDGTNGGIGSLIQAIDGKFYGMTVAEIFSFDPSTNIYERLMSMNAEALISLIQAFDGKLYGMTVHGGVTQQGALFSFDPSTNVYTKLFDFYGNNGALPFGNSLMQASNGKLYGMTRYGGSFGKGVIFSFDPSANVYTKLLDFNGNNGASPIYSFFEASDGLLYGMTSHGGSNDLGAIFTYNIFTKTYTKVKDFDFENGAGPVGSLIQGIDGKLYGMTYKGGIAELELPNGGDGYGVIFSFNPTANSYSKRMDFGTNYSGIFPSGSLIKGFDSKLYGMTSKGGSKGYGIIFSLEPSGNSFTKLVDFDGINGAIPRHSSLIQGDDGKLYGTTSLGGNNNRGVIFSFDPSSGFYTKLLDFDGSKGASPGGLIQGKNGKLYGVTRNGGMYGVGVIFSFDPSSNVYSKLLDFTHYNINGVDIGANPAGSLIQAGDGKLYGMTEWGGNYSRGVIFSFDPSTNAYSKLLDFSYLNNNGEFPRGSLIQAADEKLYGMTFGGGIYQRGVIFSFDLSTSAYSKLLDFDGSNGAFPAGSLIQASDGKLYGLTDVYYEGKISKGVMFSIDPFTSAYLKLKNFDGTDDRSLGRPLGEDNNPALIDINCTNFVKTATGPVDPVPVNMPVNLSIACTGSSATTGLIKWGDGIAQTIPNPPANFTATHTYSTQGVYTAIVTIIDACAKFSTPFNYQYIVIYDPSAGFVTGSGWINSPAGAYRPDVTMSGKAIFGFESKYQKGTTVPTGNTEFKFQVAGMSFKSTNYEWLVISGSRAQFKGSGTINDAGNYGFLLIAVDGDLKPVKTSDLFRIKIWDKSNGGAIVYDNQYGASDDASLTTELGGGSIIIHNPNNPANATTVAQAANTREESAYPCKLTVTALPNPSGASFILTTHSSSSEPVHIKVVDVWGRIVEKRNMMTANANISIGTNYSPGVYFVEVIQGTQRQVLKLIRQ